MKDAFNPRNNEAQSPQGFSLISCYFMGDVPKTSTIEAWNYQDDFRKFRKLLTSKIITDGPAQAAIIANRSQRILADVICTVVSDSYPDYKQQHQMFSRRIIDFDERFQYFFINMLNNDSEYLQKILPWAQQAVVATNASPDSMLAKATQTLEKVAAIRSGDFKPHTTASAADIPRPTSHHGVRITRI